MLMSTSTAELPAYQPSAPPYVPPPPPPPIAQKARMPRAAPLVAPDPPVVAPAPRPYQYATIETLLVADPTPVPPPPPQPYTNYAKDNQIWVSETRSLYAFEGATGTSGGSTGPTGGPGPTGETGQQGPAGTPGLTGPLGPTGAEGPTGAAGTASATGATGPQGEPGPPGDAGPQGDTGPAGAAGDVSQWSLYPALSTIVASPATNLNLLSADSNINLVASQNITNTAGNFTATADKGLLLASPATITMNAKNGAGGTINLVADPGALAPVPGQVNITANGGSLVIDGVPYTVGGVVSIDANTGPGGLYTLTSAVKIAAAGVNSYAGAIPSIGSLAGYNFIYGTTGVSICAGLPATGVQFGGTVYLYGVGIPGVAGGVRLQSPQGIQMLSDTYIENLYPLDGNGLTIQGRSSPDGNVVIQDVASLTMLATGTGIFTDKIDSVSGNGILINDTLFAFDGARTALVQTFPPTSPGESNLVLKGNQSGGNRNYVQLSNVDTVAFDVAGAGAITGKDIAITASTLTYNGTGVATQFRDATEFYVSANGSDITGNGSILAPYQTIQKAITQAELISSAAFVCVINVASGHYNENLSFAKGYIVLNGSLQSQTGNEVCEITGSISIACVGANDVFNRQVTFQGFNITCGAGQSITNTSTASHTVAFQDCKIFVNSVFYNSSAACADARTYITNVEVFSTNAANVSPVMTTNVGLVEIERLDFTVDGNAIGILIAGTSVLSRCSLTTLETTNASSTLLPLLSITSSTTSTHSFGNVAFAFTSATAKTATNALYINSGINTGIIMLNCVFTLVGTASSSNNCVGYNGVGSPTIAGVNNTSLSVNVLLPQTVSVQTGITQIQYININPPGLACYSSTADQPIAITGTPQALTYTTTQFNQGTTLVASSRIYVSAQGNYALSYSVELFHTGVGINQTATTFLKKNGATIANTGRQWSIPSGGYQIAAPAEFVVSLNAGDYVEVFFSGDTSLSANATAAAGALPAIPSVVFNIKQFR